MTAELKSELKGLKIGKTAGGCIIEQLLVVSETLIDSALSSVLGAAVVAAITVTMQPLLFLSTVPIAMATTISVFVSKYKGSNDRNRMNSVFLTGSLMSIGISAILGILGVIFASQIMTICDANTETRVYAETYFRIIVGSLPLQAGMMAIQSAMRASGYVQISIISGIAGGISNIVLDYLLITGNFGFPALGVSGAALATMLSRVVSIIGCIVFAIGEKKDISFKYCVKNKVFIKIDDAIAIIKKEIFIWLENIINRIGFLLISIFSTFMDVNSMAVNSISYNLLGIATAVGMAFQNTTYIFVGRFLGQNRTGAAFACLKRILGYVAIPAIIFLTFCVFGGSFFFSLYLSDSANINLGANISILVGIVGTIQMMQLTQNAFLKSAGKERYTMVCGIVSISIIDVILVYTLVISANMGVWGIWIAALVAQLVWAGLLLLKIRKIYIKSNKDQLAVL